MTGTECVERGGWALEPPKMLMMEVSRRELIVSNGWTDPILRGVRVLLRPLRPQDTDDLWADVQDADVRYFTGTHRAFTYEEIASYCSTRAEATDRMTLAVTDIETGDWLGEIVLNDYDEPNRSASVRIALGPRGQGRGVGTEALCLLLSHAFGPLRLHRVGLEVYDFNARAIRAYENVGFRHEGRMRDALWWDGHPHDALLMGILAPEWERSHP